MGRWAFAEAAGTFLLVFVGTSAIALDARTSALGDLGVALAFGLVVAAMVQTFAHVSGAHLNPAVTLGMWLAGHLPGARVPAYVVAQLAGAVAASVLVRALFGMAGHLGATVPTSGDLHALMFEAVATLLLVGVVFGTADSGTPQGVAAMAIGAVVLLDALVAGPMSGASMNPARSFGPALVGDIWQAQWVYWLGPAIGALAAVGLRSAAVSHVAVVQVHGRRPPPAA